MGISRSVTMLIAYLMTYEDLFYHEALRHVRETRPIANPNSGFEKHLLRLEISKSLLKK